MAGVLIRKLEQFTKLSTEDKAALDRATAERIRKYEAHQDIINEGDAPRSVNLVLSGWACRYKMLEDGRRQIIAFLLPGDVCDYNAFILREMDHSVGTLTSVTLSEMSRETFEALTLNHPRITQALWWETLVYLAVQREWTVNLGQREALERVPHLLCELFIRLRSVGSTQGTSCEFPITQSDLGEATGLSAVHINRTLQDLRAANLIMLRDRTLTIPNLEDLKRASKFNPNYLHLGHEGAPFDAND